MTDDEVPNWLSPTERAAWEACGRIALPPWSVEVDDPARPSSTSASVKSAYMPEPVATGRPDTARFIATARTALPAALRALAEAREAIIEADERGSMNGMADEVSFAAGQVRAAIGLKRNHRRV